MLEFQWWLLGQSFPASWQSFPSEWWHFALIIVGVLFLVWLLLENKKSRPDGEFIRQVHPYRIMMQYIMPTRNESIVYYDFDVEAEKLLKYIEEAREHFHVDVTHCIVAAAAVGFFETPEMNRFVVGRRLYQRKGTWITFSMKRKKLDKKAKLAAVKKKIEPTLTFRELCEEIQKEIEFQRSGKKTYHDKEYSILTSIPRPFLNFGIRFIKWLDYYNILPASFIDPDPMYTSLFVANLGSLKMSAAYHHLYEWGTCPLFLMAGKVEERPVVVDGKIEIKKILPIRFAYDERIDDGLTANYGMLTFKKVLEDPYRYLGCLKEDGSDAVPLGETISKGGNNS